jgi:hypothetical protein
MGLLMYLTDPANWVQQDGGLDAETCAERWLEMLDNAYDTAEAGCAVTLPSGSRVIRINPTTGHLEELGEDSAWDEPSGDYAVPPITPREGGAPEDQICLAAANAANVYEQLYENITDSIAGGLDEAEAYTALVVLFITLVGWEFAPIAAALAAFFLAVFSAIYAVVGFIAADVWDSTFTDNLVCLLVSCASNDDGVVTFDWSCVTDGLPGATGSLSEDQIRLLGQLLFIFQVTGGVDGLNQAGATTAITTRDCSSCNPAWCWRWGEEFGLFSDDWTIYSVYGSIEDNALLVNQLDEDSYSLIALLDAFNAHVVSFTVTVYAEGTPELGVDVLAWGHYDGSFHEASGSSQDLLAGTHNYVFTLNSDEVDTSQIYINPNGGTLTNVKVLDFYLTGTGERPFGTENNCTP